MRSGGTLASLQVGRALAAIAVACCHAEQFARQFDSPPRWLGQALSKGYLGVDFFFVLSGFIIYYSNFNRAEVSGWAGRYSWSRLTRIFVPYLPIGAAIAAAYAAQPQLAGAHEWNWFSTITLLPSTGQPALGVAWTLQHEVIFYGLMLVFLIVNQVMLGCLIWLLGILAAEWFGIAGLPGLSLIDIEFMMGILVAWCFLSGRGPNSALLLATGAGCCAAALTFPHPHARLLFGAGVALLMLPILRIEAAGRLRVAAVGLLLGNASYALYLIHIPLMRLLARPASATGSLATILMLVGASILAGVAYHLWLERPALEFARRRGQAFGRLGPVR